MRNPRRHACVPPPFPDRVRTVLAAAKQLPSIVPGVVAIGLVGSWARGQGRSGSDIDLIVLSSDPGALLNDASWARVFGDAVELVETRDFGAIQERRLHLPGDIEVEIGVGSPTWATVSPLDAGTQRVVADGFVALFDPEHLLADLGAVVASRHIADVDQEIVLATTGVTRVTRVGETVRRPNRPFTSTVQRYLAHLHANGIDFVPEPLGYDDDGREVLSYVDGEAPTEPLPPWATTDEALVRLAEMLRRLHDASQGWAVPPDAVWGSIPGSAEVITEPLFTTAELVSHRDYCPGNVIFRNELPTGLIDFDLAQPTTRVADLVNALYWWAPLVDPTDRPPHLREVDVMSRVRLFADSYEMTAAQRAQIAPIAVRRARNSRRTTEHAATVDPVFRRWWDEGLRERVPRDEAWITDNARVIADAL